MKMPSTYISLLLCGLMLLFYFNFRDKASTPAADPQVKENRPDVKRISPVKPANVPLFKDRGDGNKQRQTTLKNTGALFFWEVITNITPSLKNLR